MARTPEKMGFEKSKRIPLTQGKFAIVDAEDYEWLSQYKWFAHKGVNTYYARRHATPRGRKIYMHREIMRCVSDSTVKIDHISRRGFDNRKTNLRRCTAAQNITNSNGWPNRTSRFKGVSWYKQTEKWEAFITKDYKKIRIGYFDNEIEAAKARDEAAKKIYGEFAKLNFPPKLGYEARRFTVDWHNRPETVNINGKICHFRSQQERKWARYLQILKETGAIIEWLYEPKTFWFEGIKRGIVSYKPDFRIVDEYTHLWHEVKVHLTQKDIVKFKRLAKYYPDETLVLVMNTGTKKANQIRLKDNALMYIENILYAAPIFRKFGIK